jgi:ATP-dependent DNA helicase RecQ
LPTPASILKDTFGYDTFRPNQRQVIDNVLARKDTLAVMPTGGGKSLCYQIPALLFPGLTVVVSPLIALMKDQVEQLRTAGVPALFLNSSLSPEAYQQNMADVASGAVKLLYVAPETLLTPRIYALLDGLTVDLLTIDEAHCISEWGHDFRPEYRQLVEVRRRYPRAVCLALTATATPRVRSDIKNNLGFSQSNEFIASFNRENLYIEVLPKRDPEKQTLRFLERFKDQSGIIYCFSRRQVDDLAAYLSERGFSVRPYHAGLEDDERRRNQEAFIREDVQIMVATIAFGMGINKPNVRFVIHYDLPKSIEGYYQEIGRSGRDGLPAHCLLLYSYSDVAKQRYFIDQKEGNEHIAAIQHLDAIVKYAEDELTCRRKPLLAYFGETYTQLKCQNCDNCNAEPPQLADVTILAQKFMSCVLRTGQRFGAAYVTEVLRGSQGERVLANQHDQLSTFGIGADLSAKQWQSISRQLIQMGYLSQEGEYRILSLTPTALEALKKRSRIMGQIPEVEARPRNQKARQTELEYNPALFAVLRQKRKELADAANVPPYVIFSDKTLVEMASYFPQSMDGMLKISGVGQVKLRQYGETFRAVIQEYCQAHKLPENFPAASRREARGTRQTRAEKSDAGRRLIFIGEAYNAGESVANLMKHYGISQGTIVDHLARYMMAGNSLRHGSDLPALATTSPAQQAQAFAIFSELGANLLKPAFERLGEQVSYEELKVLRLLYLLDHSL